MVCKKYLPYALNISKVLIITSCFSIFNTNMDLHLEQQGIPLDSTCAGPQCPVYTAILDFFWPVKPRTCQSMANGLAEAKWKEKRWLLAFDFHLHPKNY